jgi:hypothetical protein
MLKTNHIHDGNAAGVVISRKAKATLEVNNIHSNTLAGVQVKGECSEALLDGNHIYNGINAGVTIKSKANATLQNNNITVNDGSGVQLQGHATATLTGNIIKGNGVCIVVRTEEEVADWSDAKVSLHGSSSGFPGLRVLDHSIITMLPCSNIIEGNGKVGGTVEQVLIDDTSQSDDPLYLVEEPSQSTSCATPAQSASTEGPAHTDCTCEGGKPMWCSLPPLQPMSQVMW